MNRSGQVVRAKLALRKLPVMWRWQAVQTGLSRKEFLAPWVQQVFRTTGALSIRAEPRAFSESNPIAVLDHFAGWHRSRRRCERLESTTPVRQQSHLRIEHKRYRPKE